MKDSSSELREKIELKLLWLSHTHTDHESNELFDCVEELIAQDRQELLKRIEVLMLEKSTVAEVAVINQDGAKFPHTINAVSLSEITAIINAIRESI